MVVQQMFKYRIYPSTNQKFKLINNFKICKHAYNNILSISNDAYKFGGVSLTKFDYDGLLKGYSNEVHSQILQNVSDRVHKAFSNFFRRAKDKSCKQKGFPRFKSRVNSITFPQSGFKLLSDKRLKLSKIGNIPIILHRVPKGKVKTLTIKQNKISQWFAIFSCELPDMATKHIITDKVGIDVGLMNYATLSNGELIDNPRYLLQSEKRIKILQRRVSKKKKGSSNRRKARYILSKQHLKIANQRDDFLHQLSRRLAKAYSFIAVENLNIQDMAHNNHLAKYIHDASWNKFINMLSYKAVTCGGQLVKVNPKNTSKTCSKCGAVKDMPLIERRYICPSCSFACDRDINAAINILKVGTDCAELNACGHNVRPSLVKAVVDESGTICDKGLNDQIAGSPLLQ